MFFELMGKEEMRRFSLEHCGASDTTKPNGRSEEAAGRLKISTHLSVLDSFVWLFLSSMASCDTRGMDMNIIGVQYLWVLWTQGRRDVAGEIVNIWCLPPDFLLVLVVGFCAGAKQGTLTASLMIEDTGI